MLWQKPWHLPTAEANFECCKMLQAKVEFPEKKKLAEKEKSFNRLDQYNKRNNLDI